MELDEERGDTWDVGVDPVLCELAQPALPELSDQARSEIEVLVADLDEDTPVARLCDRT